MVCPYSLRFAIPEPSQHMVLYIYIVVVYDWPEVHFYSHGARGSIPHDVIIRQEGHPQNVWFSTVDLLSTFGTPTITEKDGPPLYK